MTRIRKILVLTGLSSAYLLQGVCQLTGDGMSFLPNLSAQLAPLLGSIGLGGGAPPA